LVFLVEQVTTVLSNEYVFLDPFLGKYSEFGAPDRMPLNVFQGPQLNRRPVVTRDILFEAGKFHPVGHLPISLGVVYMVTY